MSRCLVPDKTADGQSLVQVLTLVEGEEYGLEQLSVCRGSVDPKTKCQEALKDMHDNNLNLGLIGNCTISSFVNRKGAIVFGCLPQLDSDPMFSHLLSGGDFVTGRGFWDILTHDYAHSHQNYLRNTAILVTTVYDIKGSCLQITDFCPRFKLFGRSFHPASIVRQIRPLRGHPRITIRCRPTGNYGAETLSYIRGVNHITYSGSEFKARITTDVPTTFITEEVPFVCTNAFTMILGEDESLTRTPKAIGTEFFEQTMSYWNDFTHTLKIPFEWQVDVIRSAITLKLCSFDQSGAILAALTTSVPEAPNTARTWDYRFCWLRDSYHTVRALNSLGATRSMENYLRFIINIVAGAGSGDLQPLYGLLMQTELTETIIPPENLPGYRKMGPVRKGNLAYIQKQNDSYGSVILAVTQTFFDERIESPGDMALFEALERFGDLAVASYDQPDAGLWELRGALRVHTFSSVMCWAACDRLAKIAAKLNLMPVSHSWVEKAKMIQEYILTRAWDEESQSFLSVLSGESKDVDACLLLLDELGFVKSSDPRFVATLARIERELLHDNYMYRYVSADDFGVPSNAFTICSFWYVAALARQKGREPEARQLFEKLLCCRNHVGLLSEDIDTTTGELWGNFPQTYSMVGLINCAVSLSKSWEEVGIY
uniref:GH15-like domain-containing protein n=2 Tax=Spongospora subterranea TaxID=70186 RepID=A0A0H5R527_9EUKA|eukprot:CRZ08991.1 hypothetical protein [Spongospora subterranea]